MCHVAKKDNYLEKLILGKINLVVYRVLTVLFMKFLIVLRVLGSLVCTWFFNKDSLVSDNMALFHSSFKQNYICVHLASFHLS